MCNIYLFIYLFWLNWVLVVACRIFSCSTWDLFLVAVCMWDLVPQPQIIPVPLHWEHRVLFTGPPGKSQGCMYLLELWFSLDVCPGVGLLSHMVVLFLVFQGLALLFSIVVVPVYIPANSVGRFPFLHTLCSVYCL